MKLKQGLVQVYTGDGKGKTTASLGLTWRAIGRGLKVCYVQFMKGRIKSGEQLSTELFGDLLTFAQISANSHGQGRKSKPGSPWWTQPLSDADRAYAQQGVAFAHQAVTSGEYDMVVCDEINVVCDMGLISVEDILSLIKDKLPEVELVLTGRNVKPEVVEAADLVTEMKLIKHPFQKRIPARRGIEF